MSKTSNARRLLVAFAVAMALAVGLAHADGIYVDISESLRVCADPDVSWFDWIKHSCWMWSR